MKAGDSPAGRTDELLFTLRSTPTEKLDVLGSSDGNIRLRHWITRDYGQTAHIKTTYLSLAEVQMFLEHMRVVKVVGGVPRT